MTEIIRGGRPLRDGDLLRPGEVARLAGVSSSTVHRWTVEGRLPVAVRTIGRHQRFRADDVRALLGLRAPSGPRFRVDGIRAVLRGARATKDGEGR